MDSSDDDADDSHVIPDIALAQDPMNPWMMSQKDKSNVNAEFDFGYKKYLKTKRNDDSDSDSNESKKSEPNESNIDLVTLKQTINRLSKNDEDYYNTNNGEQTVHKVTNEYENRNSEVKIHGSKPTIEKTIIHGSNLKVDKNLSIIKNTKAVSTSTWVVENIVHKTNKETSDVLSIFKKMENKAANKVEKKLKRLRQDIKQLEKLTKENIPSKKLKIDKPHLDNLEYLKLNNKTPRVIIDEALMETSSKQVGSKSNIEEHKNNLVENDAVVSKATTKQTVESKSTNSNIDPTRFIEVKPKFLNSIIPNGDTVLDQLDDDEQVVPRVNIEDVFEEDDVVASFRQEKQDEIKKDKEEDISLTLPGWGTWGGKGVKVKTPKRKRNRFIQKPAPVMPRRDENKGDIIIKEFKDPKLQVHKVKELPYPFKSVKDYEASIRAPLSNTFIPEKPFKKLIRPSVITKAGTIIEPMDEEELLLPKNRKFSNPDIIKIASIK